MTGSGFDAVYFADRVVAAGAAAQAIAVRDARIVHVGDRAEGEEWAQTAAHRYDFGDATIAPGLLDLHSHPVIGMRTTRGIDLGTVDDVVELAAALRAAAHESEGWIVGWNLGPRVYADADIGVDFFRATVPGRPVFVKTFDYHGAFVSAEALEAAGVDGPVAFSSNAEIACDVDGRPTGAVWEMEAVALVEKGVPQPAHEEQARELLDLLTRMAAAGLTLTHSLILDPDEIALLTTAESVGTLPLRYRVSPVCEPGASPDELTRLVDLQARRGERWSVEGIKFFLDGTIDNGTAWLRLPDSHGESTHSIWQNPEEYVEAVRFFASRGVATATHAIGDAAIEFALATLAQVDAPARGRHRIEHVETLPVELVDAFARAGVTASMQPAHCCMSLRADQSDNWSQRLGSARADRAFAMKDLLDAGTTVVIGSDWPIGPFDPREIIAIAEMRRRVGAVDTGAVVPSQRLTRAEALAAYTVSAAETAGLDEGVIAPGRSASFSVFDGDLFAPAPDDLPATRVRATIIDGTVGYDAPIEVAGGFAR